MLCITFIATALLLLLLYTVCVCARLLPLCTELLRFCTGHGNVRVCVLGQNRDFIKLETVIAWHRIQHCIVSDRIDAVIKLTHANMCELAKW